MPIPLHGAIIPSMIQVLSAGQGWLDKAAASGMPEQEVLDARLIEDMLPFAYQVKSMTVHSMGGLRGVFAGTFSPDLSDPPSTLAGLKDRLLEAETFLKSVSEDELEQIIGRDMCFEMPARNVRMDFAAEDFLLSFSVPNFYFHASTAYGILRSRGVNLGKRDFLGQVRLKA